MNKASLLLALVLLTGCSTNSTILPAQVAAANAACAPHGGAGKYIAEYYASDYTVYCVDTTFIQGKVK